MKKFIFIFIISFLFLIRPIEAKVFTNSNTNFVIDVEEKNDVINNKVTINIDANDVEIGSYKFIINGKYYQVDKTNNQKTFIKNLNESYIYLNEINKNINLNFNITDIPNKDIFNNNIELDMFNNDIELELFFYINKGVLEGNNFIIDEEYEFKNLEGSSFFIDIQKPRLNLLTSKINTVPFLDFLEQNLNNPNNFNEQFSFDLDFEDNFDLSSDNILLYKWSIEKSNYLTSFISAPLGETLNINFDHDLDFLNYSINNYTFMFFYYVKDNLGNVLYDYIEINLENNYQSFQLDESLHIFPKQGDFIVNLDLFINSNDPLLVDYQEAYFVISPTQEAFLKNKVYFEINELNSFDLHDLEMYSKNKDDYKYLYIIFKNDTSLIYHGTKIIINNQDPIVNYTIVKKEKSNLFTKINMEINFTFRGYIKESSIKQVILYITNDKTSNLYQNKDFYMSLDSVNLINLYDETNDLESVLINFKIKDYIHLMNSNGDWHFSLLFLDSYNNYSFFTFYETLDVIAPTLVETNIDLEDWHKEYEYLVKINDLGSGFEPSNIYYQWYSSNDLILTKDDITNNIPNNSKVKTLSNYQGSLYLYIYCIDKVGNEIILISPKIKIDNIAPIVSFDSLKNINQYSYSNQILINISDIASGINKTNIYYYWSKEGGIDPAYLDLNLKLDENMLVQYPKEKYGKYKLWIYVKDNTNNIYFNSFEDYFYIDSTTKRFVALDKEDYYIFKNSSFKIPKVNLIRDNYPNNSIDLNYRVDSNLNTKKEGTYQIIYIYEKEDGIIEYKINVFVKNYWYFYLIYPLIIILFVFIIVYPIYFKKKKMKYSIKKI